MISAYDLARDILSQIEDRSDLFSIYYDSDGDADVVLAENDLIALIEASISRAVSSGGISP